MLKTCRGCYLEQIVDQNTRARGDNTPSLIDLILCYHPAEIENLKNLSLLGKSDYCIILFNYITLCEKKKLQSGKKYYEKANYDAIKRQLKETGNYYLMKKMFNHNGTYLTKLLRNVKINMSQ